MSKFGMDVDEWGGIDHVPEPEGEESLGDNVVRDELLRLGVSLDASNLESLSIGKNYESGCLVFRRYAPNKNITLEVPRNNDTLSVLKKLKDDAGIEVVMKALIGTAGAQTIERQHLDCDMDNYLGDVREKLLSNNPKEN